MAKKKNPSSVKSAELDMNSKWEILLLLPKEIKKSKKWGCRISVGGYRVKNTFFSASDLLFFFTLRLQTCLVIWLEATIYFAFTERRQWANDRRLCKANRKIVHLSRNKWDWSNRAIEKQLFHMYNKSRLCVFCVSATATDRQQEFYQQSSWRKWKVQRRFKYSVTSVPIYGA